MQPEEKKKSNAVWYVVGGIALFLVIAGSLARFVMGMVFQQALGQQGIQYSQNGSGYSVKTAQGTAEVSTSGSLPSGWPGDVPAYPGATVQASYSGTAANGQGGTMVSLKSADAASAVGDYYKAQLASNGWKIAGSYEAAGTSIIGAEKAGRKVSVSVSSAGGSTQIVLVIGK